MPWLMPSNRTQHRRRSRRRTRTHQSGPRQRGCAPLPLLPIPSSHLSPFSFAVWRSYYKTEKYQEVKASMAAGATAKEVTEEVSKRWQALDPKQRRPWDEKFEQDQKRYQVQHPATERRPPRH